MEKDEKLNDQQIMMLLDCILSRLRSIEERIDCIQHTVCKNNDDKTRESIVKFLGSHFRNG